MNDEFQLNFDENGEITSKTNKRGGLLGVIPRKLRIVASIVLTTIIVILLLNFFKPQAQKRAIPETIVRVEVVQANLSTYPIVVNANGTIQAETRGNLVAQISGEIVSVADNFKTGGTFRKGDQLIQIDKRDFQSNLSQALAQLSQAQASYSQELANAKQAELDWQRLGNTNPAPDLVLRKPQLAAAKAMLDSAKAAHSSAQLNLSRTSIKAPYNGRIIARSAVLGQYVSVGNTLAEIFETNGVEVRLPISQNEFNQLGLNEFVEGSGQEQQFQVLLSSQIGQNEYRWDAKITRTDSIFDINTRQIDVIAEVSDPFGKESNQPALKIGQFVNAQISGRSLDDVFVIPNKSIREGSYIYTVENEILTKKSIDILWQDDQNALVNSGLQEGATIVTTSLNSTLAGAKAKYGENDSESKSAPQKANAGTVNTEKTEVEATDVETTEFETTSVEAAQTNEKPVIFKDQIADDQATVTNADIEENIESETVAE